MAKRILNTEVLNFLTEFKLARPSRYTEIKEYAEHCRSNLRGRNSELRFSEAYPELVSTCAKKFNVDAYTVIRTLEFEKSNACAVCGEACFYKGSHGPLRTCSLKCNGTFKQGKRQPQGVDKVVRKSNAGLLKFFRSLLKDSPEDFDLVESIVKDSTGKDPRTVMFSIKELFPDLVEELAEYGSASYVLTTLVTKQSNKCKQCGEPTADTAGFSKGRIGFAEFCSTECSNGNKNKIAKYEATCMSKYGYKNIGQHPAVIARCRDRANVHGVTTKVWIDAEGNPHNVRGYEPQVNDYLQDVCGAKKFVTSGLPPIAYEGKEFKTYLPDAVCTINGKRYLVETKGDWYLTSTLDTNLAKFKAANEWCASRKNPMTFILCVYRPKGKITKVLRSPSTQDVLDFIRNK